MFSRVLHASLLMGLIIPVLVAQQSAQVISLPNRNVPPFLNGKTNAKNAVKKLYQELDEKLTHEDLPLENKLLKRTLQELQFERVESLMQEKGIRANVLKSSIWPVNTIQVSWENPEAASDIERQWVRDAIARTWEANSQLRFVGWGRSTQTSRGIRIRIAEDGPHCKRLGNQLDGIVDGMVLNFRFENWCRQCGIDRKGSIEKIAVHEFGHALGFAHEQNRSDAPDWCQKERQGEDGDWYLTIYDPNSIMNYCNPDWNNNGILSQSDIRAVQILHGKPMVSTSSPPVSHKENNSN